MAARGVDLNAAVGGAGLTPLHVSSFFGRVAGTQWLLHHGANPALRSHKGWCAAHMACMRPATAGPVTVSRAGALVRAAR